MKETEDVKKKKYNVSCVHGLKALVLLKYPYYPNPTIESIQFLSRIQWHVLEKQKKIFQNLYETTKCFKKLKQS